LFPVQFDEFEGGRTLDHYIVNELKRTETPDGPVLMPMHSEWTWFNEQGAKTVTLIYTVDPVKLLINPELTLQRYVRSTLGGRRR
jgi:hypothetical protein